MEAQNNKQRWAAYFSEWKRIWLNPNVPWYVKLILRTVELYRSDEKGWNISERKFAKELGISKETASKGIDFALKERLLLGESKERKRRKLRLSAPLRSPGWARGKSKSWASEKGSKSTKKNNKIISDPDFQKLLSVDTTTDRGFRRDLALMEKLDEKYPVWKYEEEWKEARRFLSYNRKQA